MTKQIVYLDHVLDEDSLKREVQDESKHEAARKYVKTLDELADQAKLSTLQSQVIFVAVCQVGLAYFVAKDMLAQSDVLEYPVDYGFAVSKFVTGLLLHWLCQSRIR